MTSLKPRGAEGGPKRTPPHLGDAWQKKTDYEVEQVTADIVLFYVVSVCNRYLSEVLIYNLGVMLLIFII